MRKTIYMNDPLIKLKEQTTNGGFSRRLGEIVERYDIIMKLTPEPPKFSREELKGVKVMKFVVRSETTEALCCSDKFDTLEEAREQMALWVVVDDDLCGESQDWADYILLVPDEDVEDAVHGHADTEKFVEGKCGNEYHGSHYWEM